MIAKTCGQCAYAIMHKGDFTKRLCGGAPPQLIVLPTPKGIAVQNARPVVGIGDTACALFEQRTGATLSVISNDETQPETKQ